MFRYAALLGFLACAFPVEACWQEAGSRYQIDPALLYAIARTESSLRPAAVNRNPDGSLDVGLMQINSRWLPALARYGIGNRELLEPCTNIHVGAWILAQNFQRFGSSWNAVGAYNAHTPALKRAYAWKVYRNLQAMAN